MTDEARDGKKDEQRGLARVSNTASLAANPTTPIETRSPADHTWPSNPPLAPSRAQRAAHGFGKRRGQRVLGGGRTSDSGTFTGVLDPWWHLAQTHRSEGFEAGRDSPYTDDLAHDLAQDLTGFQVLPSEGSGIVSSVKCPGFISLTQFFCYHNSFPSA